MRRFWKWLTQPEVQSDRVVISAWISGKEYALGVKRDDCKSSEKYREFIRKYLYECCEQTLDKYLK